MSEGYKLTELGELPKEWEVVRLKDIGKAVIGLTYSPDDVVKEGGTLVLRSSNIKGNRIDYEDQVRVNKQISKHLLTQEGDILICARNGSKALIGKNALIDKTSANNSFGAFMSVFRTKYSRFVFQLFQSDFYKNQIKSNLGATINQITTGNLEVFKFPFPPIAEQEKIAEILSTVDEKIEVIEGQIAQTTELKKGLMQRLLTKGIGHTEFKYSPVGEIPESWEIIALGDMFKLSSGDGLSKNLAIDGPYPVYGGNGVSFYHARFTHENEQLIIGRVGAYCGCIHKTAAKSWITDNALYIRERLKDFDDDFMYYVLTKLDLNSHANKNAQPVISGQKIYPIQVAMPSVPEQKKIAAIILAVEDKITVLNKRKEKYKELKNGLMQQLLTGRLRVNNQIESEVLV